MDRPRAVPASDRSMLIGVLANLSAGFMGMRDEQDAAHTFEHMMDRYRADLSHFLGHVPTDDECHRALEDQVHRLRVSIGEYS